MPWRSKSVEDLRKEFVLAAQGCSNFSALCREFKITRKTGMKWCERFENNQPLSDQSRSPHTIPNKTPPEVEKLIVNERINNPGWGAKTIHQVLVNKGHKDLPCVKTINNILNRYHLISEEESLKHQPYKRFERDNCNSLWQTDFKGEFRTADGKYCYPPDIMDDCSRFLIRISAYLNTNNVVIPTFKAAFEEYGMPMAVLSDNGCQFSGFKNGYTQFEKWLMDHDILPIHGRIKHPQTQGKIERFHRTMKSELLKHNTFANCAEADIALNEWRNKYNTIRPHQALNMKCPADVYTTSDRRYSDIVKPFEYSGTNHIIKVNSWGYVRFGKWQIYLSETMIGEHIEFRANPLGDSFIACYRNFVIAEFSTEDGKLIHRKISRL